MFCMPVIPQLQPIIKINCVMNCWVNLRKIRCQWGNVFDFENENVHNQEFNRCKMFAFDTSITKTPYTVADFYILYLRIGTIGKLNNVVYKSRTLFL